MDYSDKSPMKVVSINTADRGGGAECIAWSLFKGLQHSGLDSWMVVGRKESDEPSVIPIYMSPFVDYRLKDFSSASKSERLKRLCNFFKVDDFEFPHTWDLARVTGSPPNLFHCHNLHGGYFDLRVLQPLSHLFPVVLTLHDTWAIDGLRCSFGMGTANGGLLNTLASFFQISTLAQLFSQQRRTRILEKCCLSLVTPSQWLMDRALNSSLRFAVENYRVIPNGIDLTIFSPGDKADARSQLNISSDAHVLTMAAYDIVSNPFKDYSSIKKALLKLVSGEGGFPGRQIHFFAIGSEGENESWGSLTIHHVPALERSKLASYFRASDIYVHAAKSEVFGLVIAEAMACGTPVVATAVGGIPEVLEHGAHGLLVAPRNPVEMASAIGHLLMNDELRRSMGQRAAQFAADNFGEELMIARYLSWFQELVYKANFKQLLNSCPR